MERSTDRLLEQLMAEPATISVGVFLYKHRVVGGAGARVTVRRHGRVRFLQYLGATLAEALQAALDNEGGLATGTDG